MNTLIDEIFQESQYEIPANNTVQELGWNLSAEDEYELSAAFEKIKRIAKRSYNKAKPLIVTADIIRRLIFPSSDPVTQLKDVAAYIEQDKKRQTQSRIESAQTNDRRKFKQKPDPEISVMQEIFMENEMI